MPNEINVRTDAENEDADYVVCIPVTDPLKFPDNLVSRCCKCERPIQHRPYGPKRPPKICWECAAPDMYEQMKANDLELALSDKAKADIMEYLARKARH